MSDIKPFKIIDKPWGEEIIIAHTEKYLFKRIIMKKGTRSSLQSHNVKLESLEANNFSYKKPCSCLSAIFLIIFNDKIIS